MIEEKETKALLFNLFSGHDLSNDANKGYSHAEGQAGPKTGMLKQHATARIELVTLKISSGLFPLTLCEDDLCNKLALIQCYYISMFKYATSIH